VRICEPTCTFCTTSFLLAAVILGHEFSGDVVELGRQRTLSAPESASFRNPHRGMRALLPVPCGRHSLCP